MNAPGSIPGGRSGLGRSARSSVGRLLGCRGPAVWALTPSPFLNYTTEEEMANIELPRDAKGREIPLDVKVLYTKNGNDLHTDKAIYMRLSRDWWFFGHFGSHTDTHRIAATDLYIIPPDSLEKLEEDLTACAASTRYTPCAYFNKSSDDCEKCPADPSKECIVQMAKNIALRVHDLRGEGK